MLLTPGDSLSLRRPWTACGPTMNLGRAGDTTAMLLARFQTVLLFAPFPIHLMIGTNNPLPPEPAVADIKTMANQGRAAGSPIILCKIPTRGYNIADFNDALAAMALAEGFDPPVDYWTPLACSGNNNFPLYMPDGVHPNVAGYKAMDYALFPRLDALGIWRPASD